jgi:hypothetical protein
MAMTSDKAFRFRKRWGDLEAQRKDLEYRRCVFAHDVRAEFPAGDEGDASFVTWCGVELGLYGFAAQEMLTRAQAAGLLKDERTFQRVGGYSRGIRHLVDMPKRDIVTVLEAAKAQQKTIGTVMRERGMGPAPRTNSVHDATALAKFILGTRRSLDPEIRAIVERYVRPARLKSVA